MPLYEYACDSCGARFERIQKFSDPPVAECPKCGQPVRKLISSPAIQFKGTGWYVTDYGKSGREKSSKSGDSTKDSTKTEPSGSKDTATTASESSSKPDAAAPKPATPTPK
jgi:putative FmdB family regulatory protein